MPLPSDPALVHARALRGRGSTLPPGLRPPDEILESWARCLDNGLDYAAQIRLPVADAAELARRRERAGALRRLAQAELETLMQQIAGSNFLLAFADADGVVLDVLSDNRFAMSSDQDIVTGSHWREEVAGTNGLGTALATGRGIAVTGADHYFLRLADVSCTASPIRDADGRIVGLLDASSYVESRQRHTQALVQMSTTHIENRLLADQRAGQLLVSIHPRREFLHTISTGLLAFDAEGTLTALNARARSLLAGLDAQRGSRFEQLFGERFDRFSARLHQRGEVPLHDRLGSTLVARALGARSPAAQAPARTPPHTPAPHRADATAQRPAPEASEFVAEDAAVVRALRLAEQGLRHSVPVLLQGATGSGKERLLREAHGACNGAARLAVLHAPSMAADRLATELATLAEEPSPPTLLIDDVNELSAAAQATLLGWLDAQRSNPRSPRVAATTQRDLGACVASGRFRADLMYRLQGVRVQLPSLNERSDLGACAHHVLACIAPRAHLESRALDALRRHAWPGNWRELQTVLTQACCDLAALRADAPVLIDAERIEALLGAPAIVGSPASVLQRETAQRVLREWERQGKSISATARRLGISRNTVYRHLRSLGAATMAR
jgi:sigma-54 dependent transcriptional regulator, acetoin dehydrogenase operon transcriptional activator AcoR